MIRNLKALGLALVAVLAMGALAASAASAQQGELTAEKVVVDPDKTVTTVTANGLGEGVTLDVTERPGAATFANSFTAFGESVHCPGTTYTGHKWNVTPHELIPDGATTATLTPDYAEPCHVSGGRQATINTHGCDFVFTLGQTTGGAGTYGVEASVNCPDPAKGITVTVFNNTPPAAEGADLCTIEVTGTATLNQKLKGAHVTNKAANPPVTPHDYLAVTGTFTGIHVERTGLCAFLGENTKTDAQFHLDATVKGTDADGEPVGITVTDTA